MVDEAFVLLYCHTFAVEKSACVSSTRLLLSIECTQLFAHMHTSFVLVSGKPCAVCSRTWSMSGSNSTQKCTQKPAALSVAAAAILSVHLASVSAAEALSNSQFFNEPPANEVRYTAIVQARARVNDPVLDSIAPFLPNADKLIERENSGDSSVESIAPSPPKDANIGKSERSSNPSIDSIAPNIPNAKSILKRETSGLTSVDSIAPSFASPKELIERERLEDPIFKTIAAAEIASPPVVAGDSSSPPGVVDGVLRSCVPTSLACVSSQDDTPASFVEPWEYDSAERASIVLERVVAAIVAEGGVIKVDESPYLLARFGEDELELYFTVGDATIQLRADGAKHPRVDFGRNRRRVERIRRAAGLEKLVVLRGRSSVIPLLETPFDSFAPSLPDTDAVIAQQRKGDNVLTRPSD